MNISLNTDELEERLGDRLRELRILKNLDQKALAAKAGVSLNAVRHLEAGQGARVHSLIRVLRALEREEWLETLAPTVSISPLQMLRRGHRERRRVRQRIRPDV
ncbi:MAG TPA: helix-turn-helix transcriptional regulator [Steroidobacteraceae bacterium]